MFFPKLPTAIACLIFPIAAHAACHNGLPLQSTSAPLDAGTIVFEATDNRTGLQQLFSFNTVSHNQTEISANWGLTTPSSPHVSPNGQYVVFAAIANNRWDIYIWQVGATQPVSLTGSMVNLRYEDPSFTSDGLHLVAKKDFNIVSYALDFSIPSTPRIESMTVYTTDGVAGTSSEASGPSMSPDSHYLFFWRGFGSNEAVHYLALPQNTEYAFVPTLALSYYPVVRDYSAEFVTGHATAGAGIVDQIYLMVPNIKKAIPTLLPFNDCNSDNSDVGPVDDDYVLFSNDSKNGYHAYLGAIASAKAWDLGAIGLGVGASNILGMTYTRFDLTP